QRRDMDANPGQAHHSFHQQFAGPSWTPPAIIFRRPGYDRVQTLQIIFAELIVTVVGSTIIQSRFAIAAKLIDDAPNRSMMHVQYRRGLPRRATVDHIENHQIPQSGSSVSAMTQSSGQSFLDTDSDLQHNLLHGNSFRSQDRFLRATYGEFPFFI